MENVARDATNVPSYEGEKLRVLGDLYRILAKSEDTRRTFSLWETRLERVMNLAGKPHQNAGSSVGLGPCRFPVFRISKPPLSKFIIRSTPGLPRPRSSSPTLRLPALRAIFGTS